MNMSALAGVRIADFTWVWAGPYAIMLLAYLGAEVIKIESRGRADSARMGSITTGQVSSNLDASPVFNNVNLNKLGVSLDLSRPEGLELAKRIVRISDVAAENMRPGAMARLGLSYEALVQIKPDIIMLSSSAFGATGPYREYAGYAPHFSAFSGLAYATGYPDGEPNILTGATDIRSATTSAFAILAALNYRQRTGQGQYIDLSSSETLSVLIGDTIMDYTMNHREPSRSGNRDTIMAPHNCYRCQGEDKWISIAVATDQEWEALCQAMGNPEWTRDELFSDAYSRWQNQENLDRIIAQWTVNYSPYEVMERLQASGVAAVPSFDAEELFANPHLRERQVFTEVEHPVIGKQVVLNPPWKLSATPARVERASPLLGQHNEYVFGELLGMSKQEITKLMEDKVIY
jgi:benzylsuccinate CoA-transferase BbsF subunit